MGMIMRSDTNRNDVEKENRYTRQECVEVLAGLYIHSLGLQQGMCIRSSGCESTSMLFINRYDIKNWR